MRVGGSGLQRAQRFVLLATGLYRLSHLVVALGAVVRGTVEGAACRVLLGTALAASALLFGTAYRRGWFAPGWVWADVLVTGFALPVGASYALGLGTVLANPWLVLLGGSAAAAAGAGLGLRSVVGAVAVLLAAPLVAAQGQATGALFGHLSSVVSSAVMARVFWWYLTRQGTLLDRATEQAVRAEARRARQAERMAHHRALHDTVLATLTAIAAGRVDANAPEVRERCGREAAYLRRLIQREDEPGHTEDGCTEGGGCREHGRAEPFAEVPLGAALEEAVRGAECLGLRITAQYAALPGVPRPVAVALAAAVSEALNNVLCHAGTGRAWLTAAGTGRGAVVTVVDRGAGFDPGRPPGGGTGLRRSVHQRLAGIGGRAEVDSAPDEGTRVELRWPA
ncbi:ATP-binding protein [Streptomyces sp. NPDC086023]|uniref:ATP-binding protein n=1 Tax=Streptomyces sp. NPDC086023 TaxID=3365746 RepID=UPI0037CEBE33